MSESITISCYCCKPSKACCCLVVYEAKGMSAASKQNFFNKVEMKRKEKNAVCMVVKSFSTDAIN